MRGRFLCIFFSFFYFNLMYTGLVTIYWHKSYLSFHIYIYIWWCMFLHLSLYVLFLFSLYTHVSLCMQSFISISHKLLWWVLFKCFKKTSCENLPCHELSFCKVFQEFVLGLGLFCNLTSDYEFSDLRLLLWFICLLWFYHGLSKGEIVRDIFYVIG